MAVQLERHSFCYIFVAEWTYLDVTQLKRNFFRLARLKNSNESFWVLTYDSQVYYQPFDFGAWIRKFSNRCDSWLESFLGCFIANIFSSYKYFIQGLMNTTYDYLPWQHYDRDSFYNSERFLKWTGGSK